MNFDEFNEKSKLLISQAQNKAISLSNQQILVEHLLILHQNGQTISLSGQFSFDQKLEKK